jgi:hypothetical protein
MLAWMPAVPGGTDRRLVRVARCAQFGIVETLVAVTLIVGFALAAAAWTLRRKLVAADPSGK